MPEKLAPPKAEVDSAPDCPAPANGSRCCQPNGNGCGEKSGGNGCCKKKKKKNGKKKNGCAKNGCGNGNGCAEEENGENGCCEEEEEEEECKCYCYLFGPEEAVNLWDEMWSHCDDECKPCVRFGGWLQSGYTSENDPLSRTRGDLLSFNDVPDQLNLHQGWFWAEKAVDTEEQCFDWGFRVDVVYGTDAQKTQAFGNPPPPGPEGWDNEWDHGIYGWAIPAAYGQVAYNDLTVTLGHFYTRMGYEVVASTGNFFFTHALTHFNSEPFTHTGVIADYKVHDELSVMVGWTAGWDTGFDQFEDGSMFHGGFTYQITEDCKLSYMTCVGDFGRRGKEAYYHSIILDMNLTDHWQWVVHNDILNIEEDFTGAPLNDDAQAIVNYLFYKVNDCWKFGVRGEWWQTNGTSHHGVSYGVNYRPHANLVIRPEVKHYWSPGLDDREDLFAVDGIFTW